MAQIAPEGETRTLVAVRDVQLECIIHRSAYASSSSKPSVAVVVLHPYSWLGGCMYDHVVQRLYSAFAGTRQYNTVLAYNSRGVGRSSGRASVFGAKREVEDLMALCRFLQSNLTHPPDRILLVGYSHGSCVACGASLEPCVLGICCVSPPLGNLASTALGLKDLWKVFCQSTKPRLVCLGTMDTFCSESQLAKKLEMADECETETRAEKRIYPGADHFWSRQAADMVNNVLDWAGKLCL